MSLRIGDGSGAGESGIVEVDIPADPSSCRSELAAWNLWLQRRRGSLEVSLGWRRAGERRVLLLRWREDLSRVRPRGSVASTAAAVSSVLSAWWCLRSSRVWRPSC